MRGKQLLAQLNQRVVVGEGAMGSMLTAKGIKYRNTGEVNLTHPEVVAEIHRAYQEAGAEVFQTNTFAANLGMLRRIGLAEQAASVQSAAIEIVREAVGPDAYVAAGAGPTGALLEPLGDMSYEEAVTIYRQQFEVMLAGPVDFVLLETFESLEEVTAALDGVRATGAEVPIAVTMSFSIANGRTSMGTDGATVARELAARGVDIIGANCGHINGLLVAIREMSTTVDLPLMAQANAGQPQLIGGEAVYQGTPRQSGELAAELISAGVRLIGGCCGTTPEHIHEIARVARASA